MKRGLLLPALLLSACARAETLSAAASSTAETAQAVETAPTPAPQPGLPYEEIRTVVCYDSDPSRPCEGYFTMSRDGLWGTAPR